MRGAIADAMRLGAQDVVTLANRSRSSSVVTRELRAYRLERALSTTLSSAREYREQLQNFLEGSPSDHARAGGHHRRRATARGWSCSAVGRRCASPVRR